VPIAIRIRKWDGTNGRIFEKDKSRNKYLNQPDRFLVLPLSNKNNQFFLRSLDRKGEIKTFGFEGQFALAQEGSLAGIYREINYIWNLIELLVNKIREKLKTIR
jgi:hypothetical protein